MKSAVVVYRAQLAAKLVIALCRLQAECKDLRTRVEGLQEELQLGRSSAEQLRRDREAVEAALREAHDEAESLRTDLGRTNFSLGDMQETLHRLQVELILHSAVSTLTLAQPGGYVQMLPAKLLQCYAPDQGCSRESRWG